jgi:serine/threonine protein kinase
MESLRALLPGSDPYYCWTNFEFTDGGRIHEADALAITPKGVFLIEIKSWSGRVAGNQGTWVQERKDGSRLSFSNPASLNTAKVRSLASLIKKNWSFGANRVGDPPPFIQSLVWFSNRNLLVGLPSELRAQVAVADDNEVAQGIQTISEAILHIGAEQSNDVNFRRVSPAQANEFAATMDRIGLKESTRTRTAGSYELQLPAFAERGSTQDFMARHKLHGLPARVRIFSNVADMSPEEAKALKDASTREYMATQNLPIDGVVRAIDSAVTDFGPAVIFEHQPKWVRLDRFIAERGDDLSLDASLRIVEQLASTVREIHKRRITHRMLTPQSVWLRPGHTGTGTATATGSDAPEQEWVPMVSDLSLAAREGGTVGTTVATYTRVGSLPVVKAGAIEVVLGDPAAETYLAPEAFTDPHPDGVALDVFSLGALAYLLCTKQPPAASRAEVRAALGSSGLSLAAVLPEVDPVLDAVIRQCTNPIVSERYERMSDVAAALAVARTAVSGEPIDAEVDPLVADDGDVLAGRFEVKRRLGKGSTATALWCHDRTHDRDVVLKVSLGTASDDRVRAEAEALANLKQANVVELYELVELGGRPTLVLSFAGQRSLAVYLREEGSASPEFLKRWGDDLLEAVRYLERAGVAHRDVKPDNLGIVELGPRREPHLVLFDFSLAGARAEDLAAGTPPYLEPFLEQHGRRFDLAAERYAAAVTLHEMATGETPLWGDGQTDPSYLPEGVEATLLVEAIDPEIRGPVSEFLARALRRDVAQRFDTADDMGRAWLEAFAGWDAEETDSPDVGAAGAEPGATATVTLPETLSLDDPITSLNVSRKTLSAMRKVGAERIREVAGLDAALVNRTRGVSVKTRKTVLRLRSAILQRFADELAEQSTPTPSTPAQPPTGQPAPDQPATTPPATTVDATVEVEAVVVMAHVPVPTVLMTPSRPDLDQLGLRLVPPRGKRGPAGTVADTVRLLLGLDPSEVGSADDWPTASAVARKMGVTTRAVSTSHQKARAHWAASPELMAVAGDLLAILADLGGVAGVSELADPLIDARGTGTDGDEARRLAGAVIRAVLDASAPTAELFTLRRFGRRTIVVLNGPAIEEAAVAGTLPLGTPVDTADAHRLGAFDPTPRIDLAVALGKRADELVGPGALVSSSDAVPALRGVRTDVGQSLSDSRLVRLAAAASDLAAANTASDLLPLDLTAEHALRWSRPALIGSRRLTPDELATRVQVRFPGVALPTRPELDAALTAAGLPFAWSEQANAYESTAEAPGGVGQLTIAPGRQGTVVSVGGSTIAPATPATPEVIAAREVDDRLHRSLTAGGFLALRVPTDRLPDARRGLARYQSGPSAMEFVDLEGTFLRHLRAEADRRRIDWANLEGADDPDNQNWQRLSVVAGAAVDATIAEVCAHERVIAWFPGAIVRHGASAAVSPLDRLRDAAMSADGPLHVLWLVMLGSSTEALPTVDGTPVPALASSEWLDLGDAWLTNVHRAGGMTA